MTEDKWRAHATVHVAVRHVQVGAAEPHVGNADADLPGGGFGRLEVDEADRSASKVRSGVHGMPPRALGGSRLGHDPMSQYRRGLIKRHTYDLLTCLLYTSDAADE